jgi:hypothetical protein
VARPTISHVLTGKPRRVLLDDAYRTLPRVTIPAGTGTPAPSKTTPGGATLAAGPPSNAPSRLKTGRTLVNAAAQASASTNPSRLLPTTHNLRRTHHPDLRVNT